MSVVGLLKKILCALGLDNSKAEIIYMHRPQSEFWPFVCDVYEVTDIYHTEVH